MACRCHHDPGLLCRHRGWRAGADGILERDGLSLRVDTVAQDTEVCRRLADALSGQLRGDCGCCIAAQGRINARVRRGVGLKQGAANLAHRFDDIALGQRTAPCEFVEYA